MHIFGGYVTKFCLIFAGDGGGGVVVHVFSMDVDCHAGFNFDSKEGVLD